MRENERERDKFVDDERERDKFVDDERERVGEQPNSKIFLNFKL